MSFPRQTGSPPPQIHRVVLDGFSSTSSADTKIPNCAPQRAEQNCWLFRINAAINAASDRVAPLAEVLSLILKTKLHSSANLAFFLFLLFFLPCEQLALISTWAQIVAHFTTRRDYHLADRLYVHPCGGTGSLFILPFWLHAWARGSNIWASGLLSLCHRRCCAWGNVHSEDLETASNNKRLCVDDEWYICSLHFKVI